RVQRKERCAEAGREGRSRLGDTAFGTGELGGEARKEVVFRLFRRQYRHGRQYAERIGRKEDDTLCGRPLRYRFHDVVAEINRIGNTGILGHALVGEIDMAVLVHRHVLQQRIAFDGIPNVRFALLVEVDDLRIAAAFEVEDALVVPTVFVVTDEQTLRVGRKSGLARTGQAEEDRRILALLVGIGRTVHRSDALERQQIVHVGEHALLHLAAVPRVDD